MKRFKTLLGGAFFLCGAGTFLHADTASDLIADSAQTGKWFSEQMARVTAFHASSLPLMPADVCKVLGVEFGIAGGASSSKLDVSGYRNLTLKVLDNKSSEINISPRAAIPAIVFQAKVGLPGGFDVGE